MKILLFYLLSILILSCNPSNNSDTRESPLFDEKNILFLSPWDVGQKQLRCVLTQDSTQNLLVRTLSIFSDTLKVFEIKSSDYPIALFPIKDVSGNLVTVWSSGVSYRIRIYAFIADSVKNVLECSSMIFPGINYSNNSLEQGNIIVANKTWIQENNRNTLMNFEFQGYRWKNGKYELINEVHLKKLLNK